MSRTYPERAGVIRATSTVRVPTVMARAHHPTGARPFFRSSIRSTWWHPNPPGDGEADPLAADAPPTLAGCHEDPG